LITKYGNEDGGSCAAYSYAMADAMLQAREAK
jgi:hypothetical protein